MRILLEMRVKTFQIIKIKKEKKKELSIVSSKQKILRRGGENTDKNYTKKILMTQITRMM